MGQYYNPIILRNYKEKKAVKQWWYSHDYGNGLKLMEHSYIGNDFVEEVTKYLFRNPKEIVWAGDYADDEPGQEYNLYSLCVDRNKADKLDTFIPYYDPKYIINKSKKQYVDLSKCPWDDEGWGRVHPLPLLTCEGNGRGGGDYRLDNPHIGTWARDKIYIDSSIPKDYDELIPNFIRD